MTDHLSPAEIAVTYLEAWARSDMDTVAGLVADDVTLIAEDPTAGDPTAEGTTDPLCGREAFVESVGSFADLVTGIEIAAVLGDDDQALIMYEMNTTPWGAIRVGERLQIRAGKIHTDTIVYDTHPIREALAAERRSA